MLSSVPIGPPAARIMRVSSSLLRPRVREEYCDERVCLFATACLFEHNPRIYMSDLYRVVPMAIPVVVIWSSPGGVAIHYVFPVLLMTSYLYCRYTVWVMSVGRRAGAGRRF